jgi:HTH-type transcriptional regulator/antitoxin HigA
MATSLRYEPDSAVAPGGTLRSTLNALGMTQSDLAVRTGLSLKHVNQIVQGIAPITPETALMLERVTDVSARYWNSLEKTYRERLARSDDRTRLADDSGWLEELPIRELIQRGYLSARDDKGTQVEKACRFFGVADPDRWRDVWLKPLASFRSSPTLAADPGAVAVWLRLGELEAMTIETKPFDPREFREALARIRTLTLRDAGPALKALRRECAGAGVAVVFLSDIGKTRTSGAARWLTPSKALIQMSDRYKANDRFWFTFFHEAAHLLLHSKKQTFVDAEEIEGDAEEEANVFAANHLIPRRFESHLDDLHSDSDVRRFARELRIAPGIVVGRLQREEKWGWSRGNNLKRKLSFDDLVV